MISLPRHRKGQRPAEPVARPRMSADEKGAWGLVAVLVVVTLFLVPLPWAIAFWILALLFS